MRIDGVKAYASALHFKRRTPMAHASAEKAIIPKY
jgi:hypothetical protein